MNKKLQALIISIVVTGLFIGWIAYTTDWGQLMPIIAQANVKLFLVAAGLTLLVQMIRAQRFKILLNIKDGRHWPMYKVASLLVVFNTLIPFRLGELSFPLLVNKHFGIGKAYAMGALTFVRLFDLALVTLSMSIFGFLTLEGNYWKVITLSVGACSLVGCVVLLIFSAPLYRRIKKYLGEGKIGILLGNLAEGASALPPAMRFQFVLVSIGVWTVLGIMALLAALSVLPEVGWLQSLFAANAGNIAFALPISGVASLGPAQVAWTEALHLYGYEYQEGIASALMVHFSVLLGVVINGALVVMSDAFTKTESVVN